MSSPLFFHTKLLTNYQISKQPKNILRVAICVLMTLPTFVGAQIGIWTSPQELAGIPMSGPAWDAVLDGANEDCSNPDPSNQNDNTNVYVLAAAIVYARTGDVQYKDKVVNACETLADGGKPAGKTLPWARETGAYAMAADLVGYRSSKFETWLRNMAEVYVAEDNRTLRQMFEQRPNNWGAHGFGTLCAIYRYLGDNTALSEIRDYWLQGVTGPNPGLKYGSDVSWHVDPKNLRWINPQGAEKNGLNIDGIIPDDMRRGGSFANPPQFTNYVWEGQQGFVMAARILDRAGLSIWTSANSALYRAAYALQVRYANAFGTHWKASGDDEWMLPFFDEAYGTNWSTNQSRLWNHGKNAGWGYVTLAQNSVSQYSLQVTTNGSGAVSLNPSGGVYSANTIVTLTATPATGWSFDGWSGDLSGTNNPATITMDGDKTVIATFVKSPSVQYTLSVSIAGSGTVVLNPPGGIYDENSIITLTATPETGWQFDNWSGDLTGSTNPETITMDSNKNVTAHFSTTGGQTLAVNLQPTDDSYVVSGKYGKENYNSESQLRVVDDAGSKNDHQIYLKFDLSSLNGSITSASLQLYCESIPQNTSAFAYVYSAAGDNWDESTINWHNAPSIVDMIDSTEISVAGSTYSFDVTNYVSSEYSGDKIITFAIKENNGLGTAINFGRREERNFPILRVTSVIPNTLSKSSSSQEPKIQSQAHTELQNLELLPNDYQLFQNYPNPFNPVTAIHFQLPRPDHVAIKIFDILGREVKTLVSEEFDAGIHKVLWEGKDNHGNQVASGTYFYKLQSGNFTDAKKMHLVR